MSWRERDYSQAGYGAGSLGGRFRAPPAGALALIITHVVAFLIVLMMRFGEGQELAAALLLSGEQAAAHPLAILLHPYATGNFLALAITVFAIWVLAGRVEARHGARRMLALYFLGNLLAGAAYFVFARWLPGLAGLALDHPTGAMVAWCVLAYRGLSGQQVNVLGTMRPLSRVVAVAVLVLVGLMLAFHRLGAIAWLVAIATGGLACPLVEKLAARKTRQPTPPQRQRRRRRALQPSIPQEPSPSDEPDIDDILAKISREGVDALTPAELDRLEAARQAKLQK